MRSNAITQRGAIGASSPIVWIGLSIVLIIVAAVGFTPPPTESPAAMLAGWPRLMLYALAAVLLGLNLPLPAARPRIASARVGWRAYLLVAVGLAASVLVATFNAARLRIDMADRLGPGLWIASMLLAIGYACLPMARRVGWRPLWNAGALLPRGQRAPLIGLFVLLMLLAAATRLPALADIPQGIIPDEGDRFSTALDVLSGVAPTSWFDSGWYFINMVYFRLLALSLSLFGVDLFGGRMLTGLVGVAFVGVVTWIGWRQFDWRVGFMAGAFAMGTQMSIQHSRVITEALPTALLWAISIGGFLEGARTGRAWAWALAGISGGLGLYFYPSARLWALGAALTAGVMLVHLRDRRLLVGLSVCAVACAVAALPFVVHLSGHADEVSGRYAQTTVLDPQNQARLPYLKAPEPLPTLVALQVERTLGMFDRYPDGGGFLPTGHPLFGPPLAQLALVGAFYLSVRGIRDVRSAVLAVWLWVGISGVVLTVETPDYIRAVGMLAPLCFALALPLVDAVERVARVFPRLRAQAAGGVMLGCLAVLLLTPEVAGYFRTFATLPESWGSATREGRAIAALGREGAVYSLEINEHMVTSGWDRLLAPDVLRGRVPNPGRELPLVVPAAPANPFGTRPDVLPVLGQGFSFILSGDANQPAYIALLTDLYPGAEVTPAGDQRQAVHVSAAALADTQGVMVSDDQGFREGVSTFGTISPDAPMPSRLRWSAGVRLPTSGAYRFSADGPQGAELRVDGVSIAMPNAAGVQAAAGLHFVEVAADVHSRDDRVTLRIADRELTSDELYRPMDAPWGLLAQLSRPITSLPGSYLDATIAMAFFAPELGPVTTPNSIAWTGSLIVPRNGSYRMAFAAEDPVRLRIDGQPVDVATVAPEEWQRVGAGSVVDLEAGPHRVEVSLDVTHGGRELVRWNWVPPLPSGSVDSAGAWTVVPPRVLRPDAPVSDTR